MKYLFPIVILFSSSALGGVIESSSLNPDVPLMVEVGRATATVLQFAEPVSAIIGTDLVSEGDGGKFRFQHTPRSTILSLVSLQADAQTTMTVQVGGQIYLFFLRSSETPTSILRLRSGSASGAQPVSKQTVLSQRLVNHPARYRSLINLARNAEEWHEMLPHLYEGAEVSHERTVHEGEDFISTISRIYRFPADDALVFLGSVRNRSSSQALSVKRVGILVGSSRKSFLPNGGEPLPRLQPGQSASFAIVLMGDGRGRRAYLSLRNRFELVAFR